MTEYLIVTGDHSVWLRLSIENLQQAITDSAACGSHPCCVSINMVYSIDGTLKAINSVFMGSRSDIMLGPYDGTCAGPMVCPFT